MAPANRIAQHLQQSTDPPTEPVSPSLSNIKKAYDQFLHKLALDPTEEPGVLRLMAQLCRRVARVHVGDERACDYIDDFCETIEHRAKALESDQGGNRDSFNA